MDNQDYDMLLSLAETGSLTRTAEKCFLAQPTLTKRLKNIENELNVQIFLRGKSGLVPTPMGELVLETVRAIRGEIEELHNKIQIQQGLVSGTLSACVSIDYSRYVLPDVLEAYIKRYPNVKLQMNTLRSRACWQNLKDGKCHVAIVRGEYEWPYGRQMLSRERLCLIRPKASKDTPLSELRFIDRKTDQNNTGLQRSWLHEHHLSPQSTLVVEALSTCVRLVRRGVGWSIVPEICLDEFDGETEPLFLADGTPLTRSTYILYREEEAELPQVREFIEMTKVFTR